MSSMQDMVKIYIQAINGEIGKINTLETEYATLTNKYIDMEFSMSSLKIAFETAMDSFIDTSVRDAIDKQRIRILQSNPSLQEKSTSIENMECELQKTLSQQRLIYENIKNCRLRVNSFNIILQTLNGIDSFDETTS